MRRRIENHILIGVDGINATTASNLEFYLRQGNLFFQYFPSVVSADEILVVIPFEDAMKLKNAPVWVQLAFTDEIGTPDATEPLEVPLGDLIKEAGYDPSAS